MDERRWGDSNTMPEGTRRLAVGLGTNADSHLQNGYSRFRAASGARHAKCHSGEKRSRTPRPEARTVFETGLIPDQFFLQFVHLGLRVACGALRPKPQYEEQRSRTPQLTLPSVFKTAPSPHSECSSKKLSRRKEDSNLTPRGAHCIPSRPDP
jgi:hypothetical protein